MKFREIKGKFNAFPGFFPGVFSLKPFKHNLRHLDGSKEKNMISARVGAVL